MSLSIPQGADATIRVSGIVDADGAALDVSGWAVVAQARRRRGAALDAEWSSEPTGDQGAATTSADGVALHTPAAMSEPWTWTTTELHVEAHEPAPGTGQARVGEATVGQWLGSGGDATITPPAGFAGAVQYTHGIVHIAAYWKRLTGSDTGFYTFSWPDGQWANGSAVCLTVTVD